MRIRDAIFLMVLTLAVCSAVPALAQNTSGANASGQEDIAGMGYIDWVNQRAVASGYGVPKSTSTTAAQANISARRAATVDARRNLLEVVKKIRIDSSTRVENLMAVSDTVTTRVAGIIQYSQIVGEQRKPDGSFVVAVSVPLVGELAGELLASGATAAMARPGPDPALAGRMDARMNGLEERVAALDRRLAAMEAQLAALSAAVTQDNADSQAASAAVGEAVQSRLEAMTQRLAELENAAQARAEAPKVPEAPAPLDTPYTGLVVDARGTGFKPCLRPRLLADDQALYPGPGVDESVAVRSGFVRYYRDLAQAQQSDVAGHTPRTIKALPATSGGDIALSAQDAALLRQAVAAPGSFLNACKVVVVF